MSDIVQQYFVIQPMAGSLFAVPAPYIGPGDIVSSAQMWWGLRAYSFATIGQKAINIRASGDNATTDIGTLSPSGALDVGTISSFLTAHGGNAFVTKIYNQAASGPDLSQATAANQPQLVLNSLSALPTMQYVGANSTNLQNSNNIFTFTQPFTFSGVAIRTSGTGESDIGDSISVAFLYGTGANLFTIGRNGSIVVSQTDGSWHALQGIFNGASSIAVVDGTSTTGTITGGAANEVFAMGMYGGTGLGFLTGNIVEEGIWPVAFSAGQIASMNSNQHSYWGF